MKELASYGMKIPFDEVRLGETQAMNRINGHEAIKGPPLPLQTQPTTNPCIPTKDADLSSHACHSCCH